MGAEMISAPIVLRSWWVGGGYQVLPFCRNSGETGFS